MNSLFLLASAAAVAVAGVAVAQPADRPMGNHDAEMTRQQVIERVDSHFQQMDANNDGRFTREEAGAQRERMRTEHMQRAFARLDANNDGSISREEFAQHRAGRAERRAERGGERMRGGHAGGRMMRHHRGGPGGHMMGGRLFGEQGFVTREQMRERALAHFDRLDIDRNGTVTAEERRAAHERRRGRMRDRTESDS